MNNDYILFLDDIRIPAESKFGDLLLSMNKKIVVVRSSESAISYIQENGWPCFISFDHDLGGDDKAMVFLRQLFAMWDDGIAIPDYVIHSANPVGEDNIDSYMKTWKKLWE